MTTLNINSQRENMLMMLQQEHIKQKVTEKLNEAVSNELSDFSDL